MDTAKTRKLLRSQRRELSATQQLIMADKIAANLCSQSFFLRAKRVGIYLANEGEVNPSIIYDICQKSGKQLFLPVIHPFKQNRLHFAKIKPDSRVTNNRFGILEPCIKSTTLSPPWSLDLILMPLVGFDRRGNRLGMGGGFYDRTFAFTAKKTSPSPKLIGLAYSFQELQEIKPQPWDIPVSGIVTEKEYLSI
jgi:5-formyltetrahydrofolate cyclo-ligase